MKLAIGTTVLSKGLANRHIDGIGIYTSQLLKHFKRTDLEIAEVDFSAFRFPFEMHVGIASLTGLPFIETGTIEETIDLFHATDHHIPKLRHTPVVATVMDIIPLVHPEWVSRTLRPLKNFAYKKSIGWAEHIITISDYSKNDLIMHLDIDPSRISVIPLGVNERFFHRSSEEERGRILSRFGIDRPYFLYVGTIQPRKNLHRILDAYLRLPNPIRRDTALVIVGRYGWGEDALRDRLNALNASSDILWLQNVADNELPTLMQASAALVYPSLYEGFGLPILEGFAAETPVITSNVTSIPEVASDAAILVNPYNTGEITDAMKMVAENESLRRSLIGKGKERVMEYSWEKSAIEHQNVFEKVLSV